MKARMGLVIAILFVVAVFSRFLQEPQESWSDYFTYNTDRAFGASLLYKILEQRDQGVSVTRMPPVEYHIRNMPQEHITLMIITDVYNPDEVETGVLLGQLRNGMDVFIAAVPRGPLLDSLGISLGSFARSMSVRHMLETETAMGTEPMLFPNEDWSFETLQMFIRFHLNLEPGHGETIATVDGKPVFVRFTMGEGTLFLLTAPHLLSNYHIWNPDFEPLSAAILSFLPENQILWSEYIKPSPSGANPLSILVSHPPLRSAYYTLLFGVALFLVFRVRRISRPVPIIPPPENASKKHLETTAKLYQVSDRKGQIIQKRVRYLAHKLGLDHPTTNARVLHVPAEKFGLDPSVLQDLFANIDNPLSSKSELMTLNQSIEDVHQKIETWKTFQKKPKTS